MAGTFTDNEKIIYSLKYALNLTTKDPTAAAGFEFLSAPRIFPSSIASVDLIKVGEGDIDSSGNDSNGNLVDLTSPYDTVKLYRIIDPITNKVSNKTVNDVLGTSVAALAATYSSAETTQPTTDTFQTGKVYRYWFHDYSSGSYDGNSEPPFDWKGIRLAFNKATAGDVVTEDSDLFVNHISLYLGVPLKPIAGSSWSTGTGDSISYEHDKTKGRYLLNLLGLSNKFVTRINKNDFSNIKTDTASANEGDTWFTNPTYGLLSFYGIKDSLASNNSGIGVVAGTNTPRLSFCRYIGETAATTGLGGGSNQNSETSNQNSGGSGQGSVTIERSLGSVPNSEVVLSEKKTLFGKNLIITDDMDLYDYYINSINSYNLTTRAFANQIKLIDCGKRHTICVLNTGTVITCGEPGDGQLGRLVDSYNKESYIFDQILKRDGYDGTNAVSVSAGDYHSLILLNNGKVLSFGKNNYGQLGIYKGYSQSEQEIGTEFTHLPTAVKFDNTSGNIIIGGSELSSSYMGTNSYDGTNAIAIATGTQHSLILLKSGKVLGFGWSNRYQTGSQYSNNDGVTYNYIDHPVDFPENGDYDGTNAVMMAGGYEHSLILLKTGKVMAIGNNDFGQLGNPATIFNTTTLIDVYVNSLSGMAYDGTNAISITASHRQSGILLNNGKVEFCGENNTGSFGNDNKNRQYYLTEPTISDNFDYGSYTGNNIIDVKLGSYSGMMLTNNGSVLTSGANYAGQRGHDIEHSKGTTGSNIYETKFIEINNFTTIDETGNLSYMSNAIAIANHSEFKMVILKTGVIIGFGTNYYGQLGSSTSYSTSSTNNILVPLNADHTNSVIYDGTNAFYKNNKENIILDISDNEQINDHKNFNIDKSKIISINNNLNFKSNDNLYDNYFKSLYSLVLSERFFANNISLATITSYAGLFVTNDGKVISFGANRLETSFLQKSIYKLGRFVFPNSNGAKSNIPIEIDRTKDYDGTNAISVCSGAYHVAILLNNGKVLTYGINRYGQLGNRDAPTNSEGTDVNWNDGNKMYKSPEEIVDPSGIYDGTNASAISCGEYHTAVLLNNGKVLTFGYNIYGQLGDGTVGNSYIVNNTPREIVDLNGHYDGTNAIKVVCGKMNTAVLLNNGKVLTCGGGHLYMRGDGRTDRVSVATFGEMNYNSGYNGYNAIDIAMGASTTYVILDSGKALACGLNRYKSNGNTSYDEQSELMEINSNGPYNKTNARKIFASPSSNTFFMLTSDGKISSAGRNLTGGGGSGSDTPLETAVLKEIPFKNGYNGKNIAFIATGAPTTSETENYSLAILNSGTVLTCGGYNNNGELGSNRYYTPYTTISFSRQLKIRANDAADDDSFGFTAAISGNYAIVGAMGNDDADTDSGSAYIFKKISDETWSEQIKLVASDAAGNDYFGSSVSIDGNYAIIGAYANDDGGSDSGSAYIFKKSDSNETWSQQIKLVASDAVPYDYFAYSVSISGNYAIIGAMANDDAGGYSGSAYIFKKSDSDETWSEQIKLVASDAAASNYFGISVSISGNYAIVGAYGNGNFSGSAYIFKKSDSDETWSEQIKLVASDAATGDQFGNSVSISNRYAIVGAKYNDDAGAHSNSGSAYIFKKSDSDETWSEQIKLVASDAATGDQFGNSVSISNRYAIVGAYQWNNDSGFSVGSAYIFKKNSSDETWSQQIKLVASDATPYDYFGGSVAIDGNYAIVGAYGNDDVPNDSGSAYIFKLTGDDNSIGATNVVYYFDEIIKTNYYDGTNGFFKKSGNLTFEKDSGIRIEDNRMVLYGDDISVDGNIDFIKGIQFRGNRSGFKKRFLYLSGSSGVYYFYIGKILHGFKGINTDIFTNVKLYRAGDIGGTNGTDQQTYLEATFTARRGAFTYRWKMENASSSRDNIVVTRSDAPIYGKGETNSQSWNDYMYGAIDHRKTHHLFIKTISWGSVAVEIIFDHTDAEIFDEPIMMASEFNPENTDSKLYGNTVFSTENTSTYPPNWKTELGDIVSNGNVGIGTNDPYYGLSINTNRAGASHNCPIGVHLGMEQTDKYAVIELRSTLSSEINFGPGSELSKGRIKYDNSTNSFVFNTNGSNERMRIDGNGNVGIGTTNPGAKLHVQGGSVHIYNNIPEGPSSQDSLMGGQAGSANLYLDCNNYVGGDKNGIIWKTKYTSTNTSYDYTKKSAGIYYQPEGNYFKGGLGFYTNNSESTYGDHVERMRIDMDGNVGIGNAGPKNKLDITTNYTGDYTSAININSSFRDRNIYSIGFNNNNGKGEYQCGMGAVGGNRAFFSTSSAYVLGTHILSTAEWGIYSSDWNKLFGIEGGSGRAYIQGNVGIGITSPAAKLHVNGSTLLGDTRPTNVTHLDALLTLAGAHNSGYNTNNKIKLLITGGNNDSGSPYDILCEDENSYDYFHLKGPDNGNDSAANLYMKGNVGIGSSNPNAPLEIKTPANNSFVFDGRSSFSANLIGVGYKFANPDTDNQNTKLLLEQTYTAYSSYWSPTGIIMGYWYNTSSGASGSQEAAGGDYAGIGFLVGNGADPYTKKQPAEVCKMYISRGGNVGIGNLFPQRKLCVNAAFNYDGILVNNSSGHLLAKMAQGGSSTIGYFGLYGGVGVDPGAGGSPIVNITSSGNSWFNGGNIGIGTTVPGAKLDVNYGTHASEGIIQTWRYLNGTRIRSFHLKCPTSNNDNNPFIFQTGNSMQFQVDSKIGIYINHEGKVGINTTSPVHTFHVNESEKNVWAGKFSAPGTNVYLARNYYGANITVGTSSSGYYALRVLNSSSSTLLDVRADGKVGIGTSSPTNAKLDVRGYVNDWHRYGWLNSTGSTGRNSGGATSQYSYYGQYRIACQEFNAFSDKRIKENILDVPDHLSLQQLRDISCCYYEYVDKINRSDKKTIGFIAQQVKEIMPMAVNLIKDTIPNEYRSLTNISWNSILCDNSNNIVSEKLYDDIGNDITKYKYKLTVNDLSDNSSNQLYRFYVTNDLSENEVEKEIRSLIYDPKSFIFEEKWNHIFLYGKEVDDFHVLNKEKLLALNFSATQEIDRIQLQQIVDISENKFDISENKFKITDSVAKIASLEAQVTSQQEIITTLQNELSSLKQTVQQLIDNAST